MIITEDSSFASTFLKNFQIFLKISLFSPFSMKRPIKMQKNAIKTSSGQYKKSEKVTII